jgi:hypothetical protein
MAEETKIEPVVDDEAALDKSLEESINAVKAGKVAETTKPEVALPEKVEEPKAEEPAKPQVDDVNKEVEPGFKLPIPGKPDKKGKFESDEVYEKRVELMDLVRRRKNATTDEQRQRLTKEIVDVKKEFGKLKPVSNINPLNEKVESDPKKAEEDETIKADKERLRQLGGATKEDIEKIVREDRVATEVKNTLEKFIDRHEEFKDADIREVFFDFVDSNFNWNNKTGKELMTVLELARESMFKPSETIQERVLKGANVAEKVNAMQFPGGTVSKQTYSPEMKQSIDELKATGMSEEKALELLSD